MKPPVVKGQNSPATENGEVFRLCDHKGGTQAENRVLTSFHRAGASTGLHRTLEVDLPQRILAQEAHGSFGGSRFQASSVESKFFAVFLHFLTVARGRA
jgi:hypothetical protein